MWDAPTRSRVYAFKAHEGKVSEMACSPDQWWIASVGSDRTALLWVPGEINFAILGPTGTDGDTQGLGRPPSGAISCTASDYLTSVAFSPNSKCIAAGSRNMGIWVWDTLGACVAIVGDMNGTHRHTKSISSVAFGPSCELYSASLDCTLKVRAWIAH